MGTVKRIGRLLRINHSQSEKAKWDLMFRQTEKGEIFRRSQNRLFNNPGPAKGTAESPDKSSSELWIVVKGWCAAPNGKPGKLIRGDACRTGDAVGSSLQGIDQPVMLFTAESAETDLESGDFRDDVVSGAGMKRRYGKHGRFNRVGLPADQGLKCQDHPSR